MTLTFFAISIAAIFTDRIFRRRRHDDENDVEKKHSEIKLKDSSQESLVNERFQACVEVMVPNLSRLPHTKRLEYYGLYKQGTFGDCSEYQSTPPSACDLVATAKYQAWLALQGMDRITAMQNYIDKSVHFLFIKSIAEGEDDGNYELEGDAVIDVMGLGEKPSTLAGEDYDNDALALEDSQYPLHAAAREGRVEKLMALLSSLSSLSSSDKKITEELSPNARDKSGQTPLHLAADRGHIDCLKALVLAGADVNSVDHDGISILQAGVISGDKDCCQLLLIMGSNPDQEDHDGETARNSAQNDKEMKELFEQYDSNSLSVEEIFDPGFIQELKNRNIPIPTTKS